MLEAYLPKRHRLETLQVLMSILYISVMDEFHNVAQHELGNSVRIEGSHKKSSPPKGGLVDLIYSTTTTNNLKSPHSFVHIQVVLGGMTRTFGPIL